MKEKYMEGESLNIIDEKLMQLKIVIPEAFSEGKIDWEKLRLTLGNSLTVSDERYVLNWAGKAEAIQALQAPTTSTLAPAKEESISFDETGNILIEGENLEVLKVLQKAYYGKIRMIYIDPPYNTGSDLFVYRDKYDESREDYLKRIQAKDDSGYVLKEGLFRQNSKDGGHYHSNWISMMYPRIFLARNLLCDEGVIYVSIDDNEVHNLRLLMNEIFGEENFVASIIWQKIHSIKNDAKYFSDNHEYILVYAKNKDSCLIDLLPRTEEMNARYNNPDDDPRGPWSSGDLVASEERSGGYYPVEGPTGKVFNVPKGKHWVYSQENMKDLIEENRIWFGKSGTAFPRLKRFLAEVQQGRKASTLWLSDEVGHNQEARRETKAIFDNEDVFETPKPIRLISRMLALSTRPNEEDIVLDFFAGSGGTAQAVLEKNIGDGGNRKFILVQYPEETQSSSYRTIADIAKERIRRVIEKIRNSDPMFAENNHDLGYKCVKLISSNFKLWRGDSIESEEELRRQLDLLEDPVNNNTQEENMLFELLLKAGYPLTTHTVKRKVDSNYYYLIDEELAIVLFHLDTAVVDDILQAAPQQVICLDSLFADNDAFKTNTQLQFKDAGIAFHSI
jgi:adenine-specific DNA-methyltransferase